MAPGILFFSNTEAIIFVIAIEHSGVLSEGFQIVELPAMKERAKFL